jgi:hypothetical protein
MSIAVVVVVAAAAVGAITKIQFLAAAAATALGLGRLFLLLLPFSARIASLSCSPSVGAADTGPCRTSRRSVATMVAVVGVREEGRGRGLQIPRGAT